MVVLRPTFKLRHQICIPPSFFISKTSPLEPGALPSRRVQDLASMRSCHWKGTRTQHWLSLKTFAVDNINFYRLHVLVLTVVPLVVGAIFYGSNSNKHPPTSYTDSLFLCVSAITATGLNTVLLSALTRWQQVILFLLFSAGNPVVVAFWMLLYRWLAFQKTPPKGLTKDLEVAECSTYVAPEGQVS